jgi:PAS domain S-box-containing protein
LPTEYYHYIRRRFIASAGIVLLVLAGVFCWYNPSEFYRQALLGFSLTAIFALLSTLFLRQVRKLELANLKLEAQQRELELKAELLDSASDAILLVDETGSLINFNNALCSISGRSRQELESMKIQEIEPLEYADKVVENIRRLFEAGNAVFESAYVHTSGAIVPVEVHARPLVIGSRKLVLSVVRDISERKAADSKIMSSVKEWQGTFDSVEDVIWLLDTDRKVVRANKSTQRVFGKLPQEIVGLDCREAAYPDLASRQDCPFDLMMESKKRASTQIDIAGRWYEVSVDPVFSEDGAIINAVHIVKDITDLKNAELRERTRSEILERLSHSESLSQLLTFIVVSIEKECPGALCSILLADEDGRRLLSGAAPSLPDFYNKAVNRTKVGEGIGSCGTAAYRRERVIVEDIASHPFWKGFTPAAEAGLASCWSEPIISADGTLLGTFAIYHRTPASPREQEIRMIEQAALFAGLAIERSRDEEQRQELESLLNQAQKMEAIGHLSGGIAHDFNNLLTPVIIYADMLKRSLPADEKMHHKVDGIIKASHKARDLTQQLLGFGRKQVMQMKIVDLNEIISSFSSIIRRTLRESIEIDLRLSPHALLIRADCSKMDQVVLNLAINAQDAIGETGRIIIETGQITIDDEYARLHPGMLVGAYAMLVFRDSGCGMSEETMKHIYEPFFSTKQVGHGTGLGLANVYGVIKQHNSFITVQSKIGSGTTFRIFFPLTEQKPGGELPSLGEESNDNAGTGDILLVEDNEMVRTMTRDLLEGLGYTVHTADHPEKALEIIGQKSLDIDLVITDVVMPGMNGKQLFERITAERPEINKVLYMSGYANNIIVSDGVLEDGLHFIQKPFTVDVLMARVKELLHS